jgi:hypothetical protein
LATVTADAEINPRAEFFRRQPIPLHTLPLQAGRPLASGVRCAASTLRRQKKILLQLCHVR